MILKNCLPLQGKTIVVTRAEGQRGETRKLFEELGAFVLDLPALVIGPPDDWGPLDDALDELESFHWVIFSSSNGVRSVEQRLQRKNLSLSKHPKSLKFAVVGKKTAESLKEYGVSADFIPPEYVADSLINHFPVSGAGLKILLPRVQSGGRTILADSFNASGAEVIEVPAYESCCPNKIPEETINAFSNYKVDAITFTSGKTVAHTAKLLTDYFGDKLKRNLTKVKLISIGPQTSLICRRCFHRVDKEAELHDMKGLVDACIQEISSSIN